MLAAPRGLAAYSLSTGQLAGGRHRAQDPSQQSHVGGWVGVSVAALLTALGGQ